MTIENYDDELCRPGSKSSRKAGLTTLDSAPQLKDEPNRQEFNVEMDTTLQSDHYAQIETELDFVSFATSAGLPSRYQPRGALGQGGMGVVLKAIDTELDTEVAIKLLTFDGATDRNVQSRFLREARALAALDHQNIVKIRTSGVTEEGIPFHVMELLSGESLRDELERTGKLDANRFHEIFRQILSGLGNAHKQKIVHRDLKPSNIMLCQGQFGLEVKVIDFGIARIDRQSDADETLTVTDNIIGSPIYMSPEQCQGMRSDQYSDIYSLGCMMYECLTGAPPFDGDSAFQIMYLHMTAPPASLESRATSTNEQRLGILVDRCLKKRPQDRPQSLAEVEQELKQIFDSTLHGVQGFSSSCHAPSNKTASSRSALLVLILCALVAGVSCFVVLHGAIRQRPSKSRRAQTPALTTQALRQQQADEDAALKQELREFKQAKANINQQQDPRDLQSPITTLTLHATRAAQYLIKKQEYAKALDLYADALSYCDRAEYQGGMCDGWLHVSRADCLRRQGDFAKAESELKAAQTLIPEHPTCEWNLLRSKVNLEICKRDWSQVANILQRLEGAWDRSSGGNIKIQAAIHQFSERTEVTYADELLRISDFISQQSTGTLTTAQTQLQLNIINRLRTVDIRRARICLSGLLRWLEQQSLLDEESRSVGQIFHADLEKLREQLKASAP